MIIVPFLLSPLAVKRDIAVTILLRCMCVHVCMHAFLAYVHPDFSGSQLLHLCIDFKIFNTVLFLRKGSVI